MNTRELNRLTNERNLFNAQLGVVLPAMHYLLKRLQQTKTPCTKWDADIIESVNLSLRARTEEEVETIVNAHNSKLLETISGDMFSGDGDMVGDALKKLFESLREVDSAQSADAEEPSDGYGEVGFDDFRDENGNDNWPKN
jgi:hypothetical protein